MSSAITLDALDQLPAAVRAAVERDAPTIASLFKSAPKRGQLGKPGGYVGVLVLLPALRDYFGDRVCLLARPLAFRLVGHVLSPRQQEEFRRAAPHLVVETAHTLDKMRLAPSREHVRVVVVSEGRVDVLDVALGDSAR